MISYLDFSSTIIVIFVDQQRTRMKQLLFLLMLLPALALQGQEVYRTQIFSPTIKSLQYKVGGEVYQLPVMELDSELSMEIRFDEMSHETHAYSYRVIHCNADWTPSDLNTNEYLEGYTQGDITDYERSVSTHYLYTHYRTEIPNNDMRFRISGNYVWLLYEDNQFDQPLAQLCFSVVEPRVQISSTLRSNTDVELSRRFQQIDFEVMMSGYEVRDPSSEIKAVVRQNNRFDNEVRNIKPSFISGNTLSFVNNKALIFEGGNEYHSFDVSSVYAAGRGVDRIRFKDPGNEAYLTIDQIQKRSYVHEPDLNGRFIINNQEAYRDVHTESDYLQVHFYLKAPQPFFDGIVYIGGELNYNRPDDKVRMQYDNNEMAYRHTMLLKQGGYNYQYWFIPKGGTKASVERIDGSYWQAENEYSIYIYHRAWGERYDRLVGVKTIVQN